MTSTEPSVCIITLNWNRCRDTLAFLESCRQLTYLRHTLVVVDNASSDGSVAAIAAQFPQVTQLVNPQNLGFAAGMNVGLRYTLAQGADYLFVANNDTLPAPDMLTQLLATARTHAADIVSPAIYYADSPQRPWSLGGWRNPLTLEVAKARALRRANGAPTPFAVDFVPACGLLIRRECLERVGLFDERFFMYYEDMDFCLRVRRAGCRIMVAPGARMWHKVAVSSGGSDSPGERYHMARASVQFFRKHVRGPRRLLVVPFRAGSAIKTTTRLLRQGRRQAARAYLRGLGHGVIQ
jgi:GT2 family glycosyltransferase